jgi:sec-independent protein translocase protein TatA
VIPGLPSIGGGEILILLVIVLLFFGAKRIPELARSLGRGTREFRQGISGTGEDKVQDEGDKEEDLETTRAEQTF